MVKNKTDENMSMKNKASNAIFQLILTSLWKWNIVFLRQSDMIPPPLPPNVLDA